MSPMDFASGTAGILGSSELNRLAAAAQGTHGWTVQSGAVTFSSGLTFNVAAIAAGDYVVNGTTGAAYAGGTVTLVAQDATLPRVDLVMVTAAGAIQVEPGSPAALTTTSGPVPYVPTATQLEIARIYVPATGTPLSSSSITDRRASIGVASATATTTGDTLYASAAHVLARLAVGGTGAVMKVASGLPSWLARGSALQVLRVNAGGTDLEWAAPSADWATVSTGAISAATSLDLTSLSGYKRYRMRLLVHNITNGGSVGPVTSRINSDTGANYFGATTQVVDAGGVASVTGKLDAGTTSHSVSGGKSAASTGTDRRTCYVLYNVDCDTALSGKIASIWQCGLTTAVLSTGGVASITGSGQMNSTASSITAIKIDWTTTCDGVYLLEGNNS